MNKFFKGIVVCVTISLAGCAADGQRSIETTGNHSKSAVETMRSCEKAVYYSPHNDSQEILDCANVLDIWQ
jgi:hypothetical protein